MDPVDLTDMAVTSVMVSSALGAVEVKNPPCWMLGSRGNRSGKTVLCPDLTLEEALKRGIIEERDGNDGRELSAAAISSRVSLAGKFVHLTYYEDGSTVNLASVKSDDVKFKHKEMLVI